MKTVLEAFAPLNKSVEMKSTEKSPTSRISAKRNNSSYRKNNINRYKKNSSLFSSGKRQRIIGDFFSGRTDRKHAVKSPNRPTKSTRKCLFEKSHRNTAGLDETSSSSFTYSSNSQRFIDVDIAGHCSRLDIDGRVEIVELADNQPFNRSENEESEKENSPRLKRTQSGSRPSTATTQPEPSEGNSQLNRAVVTELEYYEESLRDDFCRPEGYYRYLEGDYDERQEKVEYDLDDEDMCWLDLLNGSKCHLAGKLTQDCLEMAIDRLEKMSAHLQLNSIKDGSTELYSKKEEICDDDIFCSICLDDECQNSNVILLCDSCNLAVHQDCYGIPYVPEGQWLCSWCLHKKDTEEDSIISKKGVAAGDKCMSAKKSNKNNRCSDMEVECCLCPVRGGALKKTNDGRWAHVLCALWIPEVGFENIEYLEPITKLEEIPPARHKLTCSVCKKKDAGACIQCMKRNCYVAFHIMCAQKVGTYMKIEQGSGEAEDSPCNIKKSFYCDIHKPEGAKPFTPMYDDDTSDDNDDIGEQASNQETLQKQKGKSKKNLKSKGKMSAKKGKKGKDNLPKTKSSKSFATKSTGSSLAPTKAMSELPVVPTENLLSIETECFGSMHGGNFVDPIYNYWILKRKSRNNMPLLKAFYTTLMSNNITEKVGGADDAKAALEGLKDSKKLRNEMEKVRLLLELVRKREKVKLVMIKTHEQEVLMKLHPWNYYLLKLLNNLQMLDKCDIFAQPVSIDQVPGYDKKIDEPMDFSTIRQKVLDFGYDDFDEFDRDFNLMIDNCLKFNSKHTMYYKAAAKIRKQAAPMLKEAGEKMVAMSCHPVSLNGMNGAELDTTEIITDNKAEDNGDGNGDDNGDDNDDDNGDDNGDEDEVNDNSREIGEINASKIKNVMDDEEDEKMDETICYHDGKASSMIKEDDIKMTLSQQKPTKPVLNDDKDATVLLGDDNGDDVNEDGDKNADIEAIKDDDNDNLETSNMETTKLYCHEEINLNNFEDPDLSGGDYNNGDEEDDSNDLIIETISINDDEDGTSRCSFPLCDAVDNLVDIQDVVVEVTGEVDLSHEADQSSVKLDLSVVPDVANKQDVLRFLSTLTRLIQSSSEEMIQNNITMEMISNLVDDDASRSGVAINISKEMVSMMSNSSRPKSTRKTSSIYRRQPSILNLLSCDSLQKNSPRSKIPPNFDPPQNNSTPFDDMKHGQGKTRCQAKSNKKHVAKKSSIQLESNRLPATEILEVISRISPKKSPPETLLPPMEITATIENRRTSERTKTATHRYLIDDDNIFAALMSPSKNRKRKNSTQDNSGDEPSKNRVEDEPPVLSRCPSPIEEEEVMSTSSLMFPLKQGFKGLSSLGSQIIDGSCDDDDDDFVETSTSAYKHKLSSSKNQAHNSLESAKKKLKLDMETPPLLIKSSVGPTLYKPSKSPSHRTQKPSKNKNPNNNRVSTNKNTSSRYKPKANVKLVNGFTENMSSPIISQVAMPELEKNSSGEHLHSSERVETTEMPRLDENSLDQNITLTSNEVISFTGTCEEDVLVAEECYADVEDPGIALEKSKNPHAEDSEPRLFYGYFKAFSVSPPPKSTSKKRYKDSDEAKNALHASKKYKKEADNEFHETSQRMTADDEGNISNKKSAEELTAASALLDFRRSVCHGDGTPNIPSADIRKKNIFDEFNKITPTLSASTILNLNISKSSSLPHNLSDTKTSVDFSVVNLPLSSSSDSIPPSQVPISSITSQVQFFPWPEKSLSDALETVSQFSRNPDIDSAYSTSSSSSSSLISSSPNEEICEVVL